MTNTKKTLYFEGAGCVSRGDVPNCRIRTAFHLDDGRAVYLEISGMETTRCSAPMYRKFRNYGVIDHLHLIPGAGDDRAEFGLDPCYAFEYTLVNILSLVNSLGCSFDAIEVAPDLGGYRAHREHFCYGTDDYNYGDEFTLDRELLAAREAVDAYMQERERQLTSRKWPAYSLWVDEEDPAILHFDSHQKGRKFDLCVSVPKSAKSLPVLTKENAVPGCYYDFAGSPNQLRRIYRISDEYAAENQLMFLDRVETSVADYALPGSDLARWVIEKRKEGR